MKVSELKEELKKRGLPTNGKKAELEERLEAAKADEADDGAGKADTGEEGEDTNKSDEPTSTPQEGDAPEKDDKEESKEEADKEEETPNDGTSEVPDKAEDEQNTTQDSEDKTATEEKEKTEGDTNDNSNGAQAEAAEKDEVPKGDETNKKRGRSSSRDRSSKGTKLYLGNLAYRTDERELEYHFKEFGKIDDIYLPEDRHTRRKKGFGFLTFTKEDAAKEAMKSMDQCEIDGRRIRVEIARTRGSGGGRDSGRGSYSRGPPRRRDDYKSRDRSPPRSRPRYY